jgi:pimeloyl-ACP methyl ester carboxylesterase
LKAGISPGVFPISRCAVRCKRNTFGRASMGYISVLQGLETMAGRYHMAESKFLDLGDVRLHYVEEPGPKPVLILLHGFTDSVESYLPILPQFARFTHLYAVDFRGHGQSSHTPHQYTLRNHVRDVERFMDSVINGPVLIAGHSMGGWVAGWLAALHPDNVSAIIIEDTQLSRQPDQSDPSMTPRRDQLIEFKSSGKTVQDFAEVISREPVHEDTSKTRLEVYGVQGVLRHANQWLSMDVTHFNSFIEGTILEEWSDEEILPNIQCPTLFIMNNSWTDDEDIQRIQYNLDNIKTSKRAVIDVHNHRVHEMRPLEYLREIEHFLKPFITH